MTEKKTECRLGKNTLESVFCFRNYLACLSTQDVARDFGAVCTPEFFLFKKDGRRPFELVYHGHYDDSRPSNNVPVTGRDLSLAIDSVIGGQPVPSIQKPSVGCSIKWHPQKSL
ncbi:hypothetical protein CRYUN_Cryun27aG0033200 [Craigia yunnanensis]